MEHKGITVKQLIDKLSKLDLEKEIRYEYDSSDCSLYWLEIEDLDDHYLMTM